MKKETTMFKHKMYFFLHSKKRAQKKKMQENEITAKRIGKS